MYQPPGYSRYQNNNVAIPYRNSGCQESLSTIADTTGMTLHTSAELLGQRMSTEEPWMYLRAIGGVDLGIKGGLR